MSEPTVGTDGSGPAAGDWTTAKSSAGIPRALTTVVRRSSAPESSSSTTALPLTGAGTPPPHDPDAVSSTVARVTMGPTRPRVR